jgi:ATP-dependent Clp protease ATP-binding subunit ClpB
MVEEPDEMATISILRGLKERYETHHKVRIKDDAIIAAVTLSSRYITERFLPDKAIDLVDEAAAKLRLEVDSKPEQLDNLDRQIKQLEIERAAIKRENNKEKLQTIQTQLNELKQKANEMEQRWKQEKNYVATIQNEKANIEQMKHAAEVAEREGNYGKVAEIRYGKIQQAEENIKAAQEALHNMQGETLIKEEVDAEDIAEVVARWTGIPINKMMQSERDKLLHLEEELHKRVIGQEQAIAAVSDAIRRSRAGLQDPKRPIGSFIFLGTTGVGKTELAKALAEYLFDNENMITRIDMSEYQEKFSATRLIGAPPGYVGYDEGGQLTEAIRRKPYSVVLFDEIEKAHPDVFNVLLQVLDDGRLTDNKGRTVNFKNTLIIFTSNLGSQLIRENEENNVDPQQTNAQVMELLRQTIRPEFLNRIDETIMFQSLTLQQIVEIVNLQIHSVHALLKHNNIELRVTQDAIHYIAQEGYDPQFGARPVKRAIQRLLLNPLSKTIIAGKVNQNLPVVVELRNGQLVFKNEQSDC